MDVQNCIASMPVSEFVRVANVTDYLTEFERLATLDTEEAISRLREFLLDDVDFWVTFDLPQWVSICLLRKGVVGTRILADCLPKTSLTYQTRILETLWYASKRQLPSSLHGAAATLLPTLRFADEVVSEASAVLADFFIGAIDDRDKYGVLVNFLHTLWMLEANQSATSRSEILEAIAQGTIKITRRLIENLESLISQKSSESMYQEFLSKHPVFLDPLASEVIARQRLGLEHEIDYVIRRYDGRYLGVEIEKPQDLLFTESNDFRAGFTHAFGQVLDFQRWVDTHEEYARHLMPGISAPRPRCNGHESRLE
ncbi:MAG: DUF4263 domain-containing protein [Anaerolineae bacterium]|nr:DUF4263 domain-containing protein [Anaerolineae bacterium]